jgi:hypothetical protein
MRGNAVGAAGALCGRRPSRDGYVAVGRPAIGSSGVGVSGRDVALDDRRQTNQHPNRVSGRMLVADATATAVAMLFAAARRRWLPIPLPRPGCGGLGGCRRCRRPHCCINDFTNRRRPNRRLTVGVGMVSMMGCGVVASRSARWVPCGSAMAAEVRRGL